MRALHALGHPGGSAGVEDGREALSGVVQPRWLRASGQLVRQCQHVQRRQAAEAVLPARENDHRSCVLKHVGDQGIGQGSVEERHGAAGFENAEMAGNDLPVVLRHGHGHDLIRAREEAGQGGGHLLGFRVELRESQGLPGMWNLQGCMIRESPCGAAEDIRQPLDAFLMRYVQEMRVTKDFLQAVRAGVHLSVRRFLGHPKVSPPRCERQEKQDPDDRSQNEPCHVFASPCPVLQQPGAQTKYRSSVPFRRMSRVTQWNPPPIILECRSLRGRTSRPFFSKSLINPVWSRSTTTRFGLMLNKFISI